MVEGLSKLERRWRKIPKAAKVNVRAAMEDLATDITEEMWARAPYDDGVLAGSIGWTWGDAPAGTMTIGTVGGKEYGAMRITIYAGGGEAFYARFIEFGTQPHGLAKNASVTRGLRQGTGGQHPGVPAQPFFYPVWRARRRRVKGRISRAMSKSIRESK